MAARKSKNLTQPKNADFGPAERLGDRFRSEIRMVLDSLPARDRRPARFAARLGLDRAVCHRMISAASDERSGVDVLLGLPGVRALESITAALVASGAIEDGRLARFRATVRAYEDLIGQSGGSQTRLNKELRRASDVVEVVSRPSDSAQTRRVFNAGAAGLVRGSARTISLVYAACAEPDRLSAASIRGLIGVRSSEPRLPIAYARQVGVSPMGSDPLTLDGRRAVGFSPGAVIGELSSDPFPIVTTTRAGDTTIELLDTASCTERPMDVFIGSAYEASLPRQGTEHMVSLIPRVPAARLVIDVLLDKRLRAEPVNVVEVFNIGVQGLVIESPHTRWFDRVATLTGPVARTMDPAGSADADLDLHARSAAHLLAETAWDAERFDVFRVDLAYPLWGLQHLLRFVIRDGPGVGLDATRPGS